MIDTLCNNVCSILKCEKTKTFANQINLITYPETSSESLGANMCPEMILEKDKPFNKERKKVKFKHMNDFKMKKLQGIELASQKRLNNTDLIRASKLQYGFQLFGKIRWIEDEQKLLDGIAKN